MRTREKYYKLNTIYPNNAYMSWIGSNIFEIVSYHWSRFAFTSSRLMRNVWNSRKLWTVLKELIFHKFGKNHVDIIRTRSDGGVLTDSRTICDCFNDYFVNVAAQICQPTSLSADTIEANYYRILSRPCFVIEMRNDHSCRNLCDNQLIEIWFGIWMWSHLHQILQKRYTFSFGCDLTLD
jgi:hypothetical protein